MQRRVGTTYVTLSTALLQDGVAGANSFTAPRRLRGRALPRGHLQAARQRNRHRRQPLGGRRRPLHDRLGRTPTRKRRTTCHTREPIWSNSPTCARHWSSQSQVIEQLDGDRPPAARHHDLARPRRRPLPRRVGQRLRALAAASAVRPAGGRHGGRPAPRRIAAGRRLTRATRRRPWTCTPETAPSCAATERCCAQPRRTCRGIADRLGHRVGALEFHGPAADRFRAQMSERDLRLRRVAHELQDLAELVLQAGSTHTS